VLSVDFEQILGPDVKAKLVANLPYNISTPILQRLIDQRKVFSRLILMFQREVVERITATPGGKQRGFLSVLVEDAFNVERLFDVSPRAFVPVPKVWSSVVKLEPRASTVSDHAALRRLLSLAFGQKRKTLLNNLKLGMPDAAGVLLTADIDGRRRAETLTLDEWARLTKLVAQSSHG
jgi:16S rRNA (adenine1518-N6/adenine1519-N6)-dimethyltransferase